MKIKNQSSLPSKYWLLIIAVVCILLMGIEHFTGHAGPVTFVANYTVIPMEKGISYAGTWMSDVSKNFQTMKDMTKENKKLQKISQQYIDYITELNKKKKSSTKNFYIIIKKINFNKDMDNFESIICDELNEKFLKIKDCLSRCGNNVINILEKEEIKKILFSFLNSQKFIFE